MTSITHCLPFFALACLGAPTSAQDGPDEHRPSYAFLRQAEDWSKFHAADPAADSFDMLKHVNLSDDGDVWVSFGGRIESRFESWHNFGFGPANDDDFAVSRALIHADVHAGERFRFYVEGKTAQATDRDLPGGRRTLDLDTLDLQQAFADVVFPFENSSLTVRAGRQMLLFGAQRLVSPLPWGNTLRTWDGVTAEWRGGGWKVTGIATAFVPVHKTHFNETDEDTTLFGVYATRAPKKGGHGLDLYALGNERPAVMVNGTMGDEDRQTFGGRVWGPMSSSTDYEAEAAYQMGQVGDGDVSAWFLATQAGWKPDGWFGDPRFWVGLDLASGDDEVGGDVGTFHQLFPLGHAYFGYIDAIGRQNVMDISAGGKWKLDDSTDAALAIHSFSVMETADALYNAGGAAYRTGFTSDDVGMEVDLTVDRRFGRHLAAYAGASHFDAGDAITETGPDADVNFLYLGFRYTF